MKAFRPVAQHDVAHDRRQAERGCAQVARGDVRGGGIDAEQGEHRVCVQDQDDRDGACGQGDQQALAQDDADLARAAAADELSDDGGD